MLAVLLGMHYIVSTKPKEFRLCGKQDARVGISYFKEAVMHNLNSLIIEGNVVRDPVIKATSKGTPLCMFSIASNRFFRQEDKTTQETSFFDVETWSRLAELCGENCTKGRGVRVVGRLKQDRWIGTDGKHYSKIKVVAEHIEFKPQFKNENQPADILSEPHNAQPAAAAAVPAF